MNIKLHVKDRVPDADDCINKVVSYIESHQSLATELNLTKRKDTLYDGTFFCSDGRQFKVRLEDFTYLYCNPILIDKPNEVAIMAAQ